MKKLVDNERTERQFEEGDMIYLRLQPYMQVSVGGRKPQKLSPFIYGPYRVLQRVGTMAYKLELPALQDSSSAACFTIEESGKGKSSTTPGTT